MSNIEIDQFNNDSNSVLLAERNKTHEDMLIKITEIESKQKALQKYIQLLQLEVESMKNEMEHIKENVQNDPSNKQLTKWSIINGMRKTMTESIMLINNFYTTDKEYEAVKFRYVKECNDVSTKTNHMIHIDLKKLNEVSNTFNNMFDELKKIGLNQHITIEDEDGIIESSEFRI